MDSTDKFQIESDLNNWLHNTCDYLQVVNPYLALPYDDQSVKIGFQWSSKRTHKHRVDLTVLRDSNQVPTYAALRVWNGAKTRLEWKRNSDNAGYSFSQVSTSVTPVKPVPTQKAVVNPEILWNSFKTTGISNYLTRKKVDNIYGLHRYGSDYHGDFIAIPFLDLEGKLHSYQKIYDNSGKYFATGCATKNSFAVIGKLDFTKHQTIIISEGYATGLSIYYALSGRYPVVVTGGCGRFLTVAKELKRLPFQPFLVIAKDNDVNLASEKAAKQVLNHFKYGKNPIAVGEVKPLIHKDFNDVHCIDGIDECAKQLHFVPPLFPIKKSYLSKSEATSKLKELVARQGIDDDQSVVAIKACAGSGKTHEAILHAVKLARNPTFNFKQQKFIENIIQFFVPTIEKGIEIEIEIEEVIKRIAPHLNCVVYQGFERTDYKTKQPMCKRADVVSEGVKNGVKGIYSSFCKKLVPTGINGDQMTFNEIECPHFNDCLYAKQKSELIPNADILIYAHQCLTENLATFWKIYNKQSGDNKTRAVTHTFIDESFHSNLITGLFLSIADLKELHKKVHRSLFTFGKVDKKGNAIVNEQTMSIEELRELEIYNDELVRTKLARFSSAIESFVTTIYDAVKNESDMQSVSLVANELKEAFLPFKDAVISPDSTQSDRESAYKHKALLKPFFQLDRLLKEALAEIETGFNRAFHSITLSGRDDELGLKIEYVKSVKMSLPKLVVIDADADKTILEKVLKKDVQLTEIDVKRNCKVTQLYSSANSKHTLLNWNKGRLLADYLSIADYLATDKKTLLVGNKKYIDEIKTDKYDTAYFGNLRGIDKFKHHDQIVILGRNEPNEKAIVSIARALFSTDEKPIVDSTMKSVVKPYTMTDNSLRFVNVREFEDNRLNVILNQIRECESSQAIDRLRLIHNENEKEVVILSNLPLSIEVDSLVDSTELNKPLTQPTDSDILTSKLAAHFFGANGTQMMPLSNDVLYQLAVNSDGTKIFSSECEANNYAARQLQVGNMRLFSTSYLHKEAICNHEVLKNGMNSHCTEFDIVDYKKVGQRGNGYTSKVLIRSDITNDLLTSYLSTLFSKGVEILNRETINATDARRVVTAPIPEQLAPTEQPASETTLGIHISSKAINGVRQFWIKPEENLEVLNPILVTRFNAIWDGVFKRKQDEVIGKKEKNILKSYSNAEIPAQAINTPVDSSTRSPKTLIIKETMCFQSEVESKENLINESAETITFSIPISNIFTKGVKLLNPNISNTTDAPRGVVTVDMPLSELPQFDAEKMALIDKIERAAVGAELPAHFYETLSGLLESPIEDLRDKARQAFTLALQEKRHAT